MTIPGPAGTLIVSTSENTILQETARHPRTFFEEALVYGSCERVRTTEVPLAGAEPQSRLMVSEPTGGAR